MIQRFKQMGMAGLVSLLFAAPVFAQLNNTVSIAGLPTGFKDLATTLSTVFGFVITIAAIFFVVLFLVGGIQYLTAAGDPETTKKAKQLLVDAIIGLVIVLAAWSIGQFILGRLAVKTDLNQNTSINGGAAIPGGGSATVAPIPTVTGTPGI